jgi:molybdopterin/thiamine biosynthesis adenylyltransferase
VDKYARQRGLVVQDIVADAEITLYGTGRALPYLLQCLAHMGVATRHGCLRLHVDDRPVTDDDLAYQFLLQQSDLGKPIGDALTNRVAAIDATVNISVADGPARGLHIAVPGALDQMAAEWPDDRISAWGFVLQTSVYVGPGPLRASFYARPTVLTAALAAVCGGLLAQAALAQLGAIIDGPTVLSSWYEENFWISYPGIGTQARLAVAEGTPWPTLYGVLERTSSSADDRLDFFADGQHARLQITTVVDDDAVVAAVRRDSATAPATLIRAHRQTPRPVEAVFWSPIEGPALDGDRVVESAISLPAVLPPSGIVMCGAGALGSWASAVLAASRFQGLSLCVVDMDTAVDVHNLNRQVLFSEGDIGLPKARRAAERLRAIDPGLHVRALDLKIEETSIDELTGQNTRSIILDETVARERAPYQASLDVLAEALGKSTAILSCPDNHQTRWTLNVIAERLGIPLINGAAQGFAGLVHVCDPADNGMCLACWLGPLIKYDLKRASCTDRVGEEPVPSIVTSAAIVGGAEAAALIAYLAGAGSAIRRYHTFEGKAGVLAGYRAADRNSADCPDHLLNPPPNSEVTSRRTA